MSKPISVDEFMAMSRSQRYYLTHREEIRKKATERYWADPKAAQAAGKAYREKKKAEKMALESKKSNSLTLAGEHEQLHGSASPLVSEKPGEASGGKTCLCCPIHSHTS
jgi:hypothetical protein